MSINILRDELVEARKDYRCDACMAFLESHVFLKEVVEHENARCSDELTLALAELQGWKIVAGTKYRKVRVLEDGCFHTFRFRPDMDDLCYRMGLYDDC